MSIVTIRPATVIDADLIADISHTTFYDSFAAQNTQENMDKFMTEQFAKKDLAAEVSDPANKFFIAEHDGITAGYIKLREGKKPASLRQIAAIEIARIYALKEFIGKGVGAALMRQAIEFADNNDKRVIWLGVWEFNQPAIDFYTKWGFKKFSHHPFMLGNDRQTDWLMKKEL